MRAHEVDERDARWELIEVGYRVVLVREGGRHLLTYDLEAPTAAEAEAWAAARSPDSPYALAAKVPQPDGGVGLVWLTPPPEAVAATA